MKSFLFVCSLVFSQVSFADIKIMSFEGIHAINFNGSDYEVVLDWSSDADFKVTFYSTEKIGMPLLTKLDDVTEFKVPLTQKVFPLLSINQITTLHTAIELMSPYSAQQVYRIGIDSDNDGTLNSADDDFVSFTVSTKH